MINTEVRYVALLTVTIVTIYVMLGTNKENILSLGIRRDSLNRFLRNENKQHNNATIFKRTRTEEQKKKESEVEEPLKWMNRSDSKPYRDLGDGTCAPNPHRAGFKAMLQKWTQMARKHKTRYFLADGTLLGAWWNEELIPYDSDADIFVHTDDLPTLFNLPIRERRESWDSDDDDDDFHLYFNKDWRLPIKMRRRFSCKGEQVKEYEGQCSFIEPTARLIHKDTHLDLFAYTDYHNTLHLLNEGGQDIFVTSDFIPMVKCNFMGIECRCPRKPRVYLEHTYSNLHPIKICRNTIWVKREE